LRYSGGDSYKVASDGDKHLPYYQNPRNRVKTLGKGNSAYAWWEHSPYYGDASGFCIVVSNGGTGGNSASLSNGVAPCFLF
jgi:hypothetical protein